jgi:hypothetical protein
MERGGGVPHGKTLEQAQKLAQAGLQLAYVDQKLILDSLALKRQITKHGVSRRDPW